jgi:hypothetical protein
MESCHKKCLLLNADYTPLGLVSWKKAITWFMYEQDIIQVVDFYKNDYICGVNKKYPIPAVAKTQKFYKTPGPTIMFSRKNIFLRDNFCCQYCLKKFSCENLTYDHVIPKSKWNYNKGSPTSWTNIVTSCSECNRKKGDRTPKQANMPLKYLPIKPVKTAKYLPIAHHLRNIKGSLPEEWKIFLPSSYIDT